MTATLQRIFAAVVIFGGMLAGFAYVAAIVFADSRSDSADQWGAIAGFGLMSTVVGLFWLLSTRRKALRPEASSRLPPAWLSLLVFITVVAIGFGLQLLDRGFYVAPLLAVIGFVAVGAFFLRLAVRWMPDRRLPLRDVVLPGAWGFFVSPLILLTVQAAVVVLAFAAIITGIYVSDPEFELDPQLEQRIVDYIDEAGAEGSPADLPAIFDSPTVAITLFSVVAVVAPLSEEIVKAFGAILILSRRTSVTRSDAFFAAVASSLGFAIFEGIGYTLASASSWQQIVLIRAPVVVMHVAATTIIVIGWYRMRESGRGFVPYFIAGTALHAGWNALYIGFIYSLTGAEAGGDPTTGQAASVFASVVLLGALFLTGLAWFLSASRKSGLSVPRATLAQDAFDRTPSSYAVGSRPG